MNDTRVMNPAITNDIPTMIRKILRIMKKTFPIARNTSLNAFPTPDPAGLSQCDQNQLKLMNNLYSFFALHYNNHAFRTSPFSENLTELTEVRSRVRHR